MEGTRFNSYSAGIIETSQCQCAFGKLYDGCRRHNTNSLQGSEPLQGFPGNDYINLKYHLSDDLILRVSGFTRCRQFWVDFCCSSVYEFQLIQTTASACFGRGAMRSITSSRTFLVNLLGSSCCRENNTVLFRRIVPNDWQVIMAKHCLDSLE